MARLRLSPDDYIRQSCELHLQARISTSHKSTIDAVRLFLLGGGNQTESTSSPRLFVWIPQRGNHKKGSNTNKVDDDDNNENEEEYVEALASTQTFEGANLGALAFINTSAVTAESPITDTTNLSNADHASVSATHAVQSIHQIQCMILCPRVYWNDVTTDVDTEDDVMGVEGDSPLKHTRDRISIKDGPNPESSTFLSLQMYARHCFVPAVLAMESLEDEKKGEDAIISSSNTLSETNNILSTDGSKVNRQKNKSRILLEGLEDKLRELDVVLGQCRRTTLGQIPQVVLQAHPIITNAAIRIPASGKIDLDEVGLSYLLTDDSFLNQVQSGVGTWINQIRKVTGLPTTTAFPTVTTEEDGEADDVYIDLEETTFWINLDLALKQIRSQLTKAEVLLTITVLKSAKRFVATIALENNTGMDSAEAHVTDVCNFLRPYPVSNLIAARDLGKMCKAMESIFLHIPKLRQSRFYSLERCVRLIEASTLTLRRRMIILLRGKSKNSKSHLITGMSFDEYINDIHQPTTHVFDRLDILVSEFTEFILEQSKRRMGSKSAQVDLVQGIHLHHKFLRERLESIHHFRSQHEKLKNVITEVLSAEKDSLSSQKDESGIEFSAEVTIHDVEDAPIAVFSAIDVLDLSAKGHAAFLAALDGYDRRVDIIEEKIAHLLKEMLMICKDAEDMFLVFGRFNLLMSRTRIQNAVKEFQMRLIATVSQSIQKLQSKFTNKFESSAASTLSRLRGVPQISGKILWARQIERQVRTLMTRMGNVLGSNWGQHLEGRQLKRSCDDLLGKLDSRAFFRSWVTAWEREMRSEAVSSNARLSSFPFVVEYDSTNNKLVVVVNFKESYELLFREIRQLRWLGFDRDIPRTLTITADEAEARHPMVVALRGALRSYTAARELVTPELEPLVHSNIKAIRQSIEEAFGISIIEQTVTTRSTLRIRWDSKDIRDWIASLTELVSFFEERVETIFNAQDEINRSIRSLENIEFSRISLFESIQIIQKAIDNLCLANFANIDIWVEAINKVLQEVLSKRLQDALEIWTQSIKVLHAGDDSSDIFNKPEALPTHHSFPTIFVEITLQNQEIMSFPRLPLVREHLMKMFHDFSSCVCSLRPLHCSRYDIFASSLYRSEFGNEFTALMYNISPLTLSECFNVIENDMIEISAVVQQWLDFQILWDRKASDFASALGNDVLQWSTLLAEVAIARSSLESPQSSTSVRYVTIKYGKVKAQISVKFDTWQRDLQTTFAGILREKITEVYDEVSTARDKLEMIHFDRGNISTHDVILGVTMVQEIKGKVETWLTSIDQLIDAERILRRQRFIFPWDWVESSRLKGQYHTLDQILSKRLHSIDENLPILQTRVSAEAKVSMLRASDIVSSWESEKPIKGTVTPYEALEAITKFEYGMKKIQRDEDNLIKAKDALGLDTSVRNNSIASCLAELFDLKEVWQYISKSFGQLQEIKETLFSIGNVRKIRQQLEDIMSDMRQFPNRVRLYEAYTHLHEKIKSFVAGYTILNDLKTDALKERHWKSVLDILKLNVVYRELTFGMLWEHGIVEYKRAILEILSTAQGEMALEVFLSQVRERWIKQELDLVLYKNRSRLIKGWETLYATLDEHMGGLLLMRNSPFFRSVRDFQEENKLWEDRLTKLRGVFDLLLNVQRRWVYLEGIFLGTSDIKVSLPVEWARFRSVDGEFVSLMRRIASRPFAMEILNIENVDRTLERLEATMNSTQRALGEYLWTQRNGFSRFYFLGDDDLLEIIGNSGRTSITTSHIGKMFSGLGGIKSRTIFEGNDSEEHIVAMLSKDGEEVLLHNEIIVNRNNSGVEWLRRLESEMYATLANKLESVVRDNGLTRQIRAHIGQTDFSTSDSIIDWIKSFPAQIIMLSVLIGWTKDIEESFGNPDCRSRLDSVLTTNIRSLEVLSQQTTLNVSTIERKKIEHLISELVYERDVLEGLINQRVDTAEDFRWLSCLRFEYNVASDHLQDRLRVSLSHSIFPYGFEYIGVGERLVQTPLTDRCYLTLTQALKYRLGGNPFGPAGTGKTETVKALGSQLGRFVVVMNCDETFDFNAMGRIFCGLCQVGAWGCFDEFNRLEERILSAVSQQILTIQRGLIDRQSSIELLGKPIRLNENVGIFVTMNPGYAGRRNLPENLKNLFRSVAMFMPDKTQISQVLLYSQGFVSASALAESVVNLFAMCEDKMSKRSHYDFGLRALKVMLSSAGSLRRKLVKSSVWNNAESDVTKVEKCLIVEAVCNNILPKVVKEDNSIFASIVQNIFPGSSVQSSLDNELKEEILATCTRQKYVPGDEWLQKVLQLKQVMEMRHGVMLVGSVASGKSSALRVLLDSLESLDGIKGDLYIIDPKAVTKSHLYGELDSTTMEWTDGIFTLIIRQIILNQKGERDHRHWVVFDGDIDPDWAENLNSVLDDNMILTLPSGERLEIPRNVRVILEVDTLTHATPATVSRCGLVWMSEDTIHDDMRLAHLFNTLSLKMNNQEGYFESDDSKLFLEAIKPMIIATDGGSSLVSHALEFALNACHVMTVTRERLLTGLKALISRGLDMVREYNESHPDFPMDGDHMVMFARRWLLHSILWSFGGSCSWPVREQFNHFLCRIGSEFIPCDVETNLFDYRVKVENGEYETWSSCVPRVEVEYHRLMDADIVVPTTDTIRNTDIVQSFITSRLPLILCGPAGSGKTMTLMSTLQSLEGAVVANLSFSSQTTPNIIIKTFRQYCVYKRRGKDIILEPSEGLGVNTWLIIFCDEINLPENDMYGTQRVISFMRQLVEQGGFWRDDNIWVRINRIQFVGACNPPSDAGRVILSPRFLRHAPLIFVDFPAKESLIQIYGSFNAGIMRLFPSLKTDANAITEAMVDVYLKIQMHFTPDMQPHYFFSPRELTRWVRGIYGAVKEMDSLDRHELVRLWAHEALRLFSDRLVETVDQDWCRSTIDDVARTCFTGINHEVALAPPILYSSWISKDMRSVTIGDLLDFVESRIRIFYEEELDVPLVVFDDVVEHILRIDRVLRQPLGHCLLIGDSGTGKTVLSKFVAWMQGLSIFQIKPHSRYTLDDFNEDLRKVLRRVGVDGEKICFIFDETNALSGGFLEAMNALLASGEVPGLFEGENYTALINACRDSAARDGVLAVSEDELWRRFISVVQRNLHIVFTMNPHGGHWKNRTRSSPALFNRCVVDWIGTWSSKALGSVGKQLTSIVDLDNSAYLSENLNVLTNPIIYQVRDSFAQASHAGLHHAVVAAMVEIHMISLSTAEEIAHSSSSSSRTYISPRDYMDFINTILSTIRRVQEEFEDQQLHVNAGISKFQQTQDNVGELKLALDKKRLELSEKEYLANQKLQQMVTDQKAAEAQRDVVEKISLEVERQECEINRRKDDAQRQLDDAEPALLSSKSAVNAISKKDLDEVRNLIRPPMNVQKTLECIAVMLGEKKVEWSDVRKMINRSDFIPSILNFDAGMLTSSQIKIVQQDYLDGNDELNYESVMRSSRACGPLYRWAESQVMYSIVHNRVQPLREEVDRLITEAGKVRSNKQKIEMEVHKLELSIEQYKADYATLIRDVEALKTEMELVGMKIKRAENLITSFQKESKRWSNTRDGFYLLLQNLVGDSLLISAFLTYSGFFDFRTRASLLNRWMHVLDCVEVKFNRDIDIVASLSTASERLKWSLHGLSSDSLSAENGVILKHHVRYPLVIDPSGQAMDFIMSQYSDQKIQKTSFQDNAFVKTLTSAIRFGTYLMIENVESIDPIIFPVLNREIQRTGGRSLIRVGADEVDYSPKFSLFLCTKNPASNLTPDICSKVTLVNFTQTPASLEIQSLSLILQYLRPDIQDKRVGGLRLHSEQTIRLRDLENKMLSSISAVAGNILDNDKLVEGMETLTCEGRLLEEQMRSCAESMLDVEVELEKYKNIASLCRKLFVLLLSMREINLLYEFSAEFLIRTLEKILTLDLPKRLTEKEKLEQVRERLLSEITARSARRMISDDKAVFSLLLGRLLYGARHDESFSSMARHDECFSSMEEIRRHIQLTFGAEFPSDGRGIVDLNIITSNDISSTVPLLICSAPGFDVSSRIQRMADDHGNELDAMAMGSQECFHRAESMLTTASKRGSWVLLKNCHLCLEWLQETLLRKLSSIRNTSHPNFRLFLSSEVNQKLPSSLIRVCDILLAEAPTGLKASLFRVFSCINPSRFKYAIRNRLYLLLSWLHAVLQERLRFIPKGWCEKYEFMESDITYALDIIDELFSHASKGRQQLDPTNLPWLALRTILSHDIYGGRISQDIDRERLNDIINSIFQPKAYDFNFRLGATDDAPTLPEGNTIEEYRIWIEALPDVTSPSWVGLDVTEEEILSKTLAHSVLSKAARLNSIILERDNP